MEKLKLLQRQFEAAAERFPTMAYFLAVCGKNGEVPTIMGRKWQPPPNSVMRFYVSDPRNTSPEPLSFPLPTDRFWTWWLIRGPGVSWNKTLALQRLEMLAKETVAYLQQPDIRATTQDIGRKLKNLRLEVKQAKTSAYDLARLEQQQEKWNILKGTYEEIREPDPTAGWLSALHHLRPVQKVVFIKPQAIIPEADLKYLDLQVHKIFPDCANLKDTPKYCCRQAQKGEPYFSWREDVFLESALACSSLLELLSGAETRQSQQAESPYEIELIEQMADELERVAEKLEECVKTEPDDRVPAKLGHYERAIKSLKDFFSTDLVMLQWHKPDLADWAQKKYDKLFWDIKAVDQAIADSNTWLRSNARLQNLQRDMVALAKGLRHIAKMAREDLTPKKPAETEQKIELQEKDGQSKTDDIPTLTEDEVQVLNYLHDEFPQVRYQRDIEDAVRQSRKTIKAHLDKFKEYRFVSLPDGKKKGCVITSRGIDYIKEHFS